jgi:ferredoxin
MRYAIRPETRRKMCPGCGRVRFIPIATAPYCMESCKRDALAKAAAEHDKKNP